MKRATLIAPALRFRLGLVAALLLSSAGSFGQTLTIPELSRARDAAARKKSDTEIERRQILELYDQSIKSVEEGLQFRATQVGQERTRIAIQRELAVLQGKALRGAPVLSAPHREDEASREVEVTSALHAAAGP